jgi:aspartyl-tRNA(Asn)/glutamyl-tRNA(Gln) amidotransferase subunit B
MKLEPVIGLEIHVQLKTKSKMFCSCDNTGEDKSANTTICPVCLGHPGTLPVPNAETIHMAVKAALVLNLHINQNSKFDRKNYFYPDLPKGYQISQHHETLGRDGYLEIETKEGVRRIGIEEMHLEEDTAKLFHHSKYSLLDFNRAGTPLMEIVTKPEVKNPEEARIFLQELKLLMRYLDISDADMEKGHLRCDANLSLRPVGDSKFYHKTEIKNLNSFKSVEKALTYEIKRQTELWEKGTPQSTTTTCGWDEKKGVTVVQRQKEALHDYRYFPEPDIPTLKITDVQIKAWAKELPELPQARRKRLQEAYSLGVAESRLLTEDRILGDFTEGVISALASELEGDSKAAAKLATNWIVHKLSAILTEKGSGIEKLPFDINQLVAFLLLVARRQVNSTNAQLLLRKMVETGRYPDDILQTENLSQSGGEKGGLAEAVTKILATYPEQVEQYKAGKVALMKFFLGAVMKETKGKVDPIEVEEFLKQKLE